MLREKENQIKEILNYDLKTGIFTWIAPTQGNRIQGKQAGYVTSLGYRVIEIDGTPVRANRLAWWWITGSWPEKEIDHKNQDKLDDRFENLRDVSASINCHNRKQYNQEEKSGQLPMGVYIRKGKRGVKYRAMIGVDGKLRNLGTYSTPEEAEAAYLKEKVKYV